MLASRAIFALILLGAVARADDPPHRPGDTGRFNVAFTERHPLSPRETFLHRTTAIPRHINHFPTDTPQSVAVAEYDLSRESFDLVVPKTYDKSRPQGLFVWIGVTEYSPEWLEVLAKHNIIFITPNNIGGRGWTIRQGLCLDAVHNVCKFYNIDRSRIFIAGFSAGGAIAAETLQQFPDVFSGGVFMMGGYFYHSISTNRTVPIREGERREPTTQPHMPWFGDIEPLKESVKIVLMKGEGDPTSWKPEEGQSDLEALTLDGFTHVSLFILPKHGHMHPHNDYFEKAIKALDEESHPPPATQPTKDPKPLPSQVAQAKRLLYSAYYTAATWQLQPNFDHIKSKLRDKAIEQTRRSLQQIIDDFPTTPAAAEARKRLTELDKLVSQPTTEPTAHERGTGFQPVLPASPVP
ncbi:MAG TPA: prolyl oligopeptidase family serine peptidase [Tepidisphaeraceae bacterium]|jgi:hypothetical protein